MWQSYRPITYQCKSVNQRTHNKYFSNCSDFVQIHPKHGNDKLCLQRKKITLHLLVIHFKIPWLVKTVKIPQSKSILKWKNGE